MSVKGTEQVIKNLSTMDKGIFDEMVLGCQAVQAKVVNDARANCATGVTGTLAQSIQPGDIIVSDVNVVAYIDANADYASYVENGTRPHFPPVDALKDWAAKFLGDPNLAFLVARAISRRGTIARPFLGPAVLANMDVFRQAMEAAKDRGIEKNAA